MKSFGVMLYLTLDEGDYVIADDFSQVLHRKSQDLVNAVHLE